MFKSPTVFWGSCLFLAANALASPHLAKTKKVVAPGICQFADFEFAPPVINLKEVIIQNLLDTSISSVDFDELLKSKRDPICIQVAQSKEKADAAKKSVREIKKEQSKKVALSEKKPKKVIEQATKEVAISQIAPPPVIEIAPPAAPEKTPESKEENLNQPPAKMRFPIHDFVVEGDELPISSDEIDEYLSSLKKEPKDYALGDLLEVSKNVEKIIRDAGFAFYRVVLPPQSIDTGEVHLQVVSYKIENIKTEGNDYFSTDAIEDSVPELEKGISPNTQALANGIKVSNRHPSRQLQVTFQQHEFEDKIDANIKVNEQRPYQVMLNFNNTGSDSSGEYRLMGGLQYSNLWGLDHIVNASYTLPPDYADTIKQYGGNYSMPIYPLRGWLTFNYALSSTNNGVVANDLAITGAGEMMGLHYFQFLPRIKKYEHSLDIGMDSRYFMNDVQFKKVQLGSNVRSMPFSISYKAEYPFDEVRTGYFAQWAINMPLWSDNDDKFYNRSRLGASSSWDVFRYGANAMTSFDEWLVTTSVSGQYSNQPLIAGEQIGIGGSFDVRGYEQRETGADNGQIAKIELTTPAWEKANAFVFFDYGHGSRENAQKGEIKDWHLSSTGIGAKWSLENNVNTSLTFATALNDATTTKAFNNRLLLNVALRY